MIPDKPKAHQVRSGKQSLRPSGLGSFSGMAFILPHDSKDCKRRLLRLGSVDGNDQLNDRVRLPMSA